MSQVLYSAEQVALLLNLQTRTVRNYLRQGRLKGVRIGKQYRIARKDLETFTGRPVSPAEPADPVRRHRHVEASSVVQIDAISPEAAGGMTNTLLSAARGNREGDQPLRIDTIYDEERARLKVILTGGTGTTAALLRLIGALSEASE